jgi:hypothetical protein
MSLENIIKKYEKEDKNNMNLINKYCIYHYVTSTSNSMSMIQISKKEYHKGKNIIKTYCDAVPGTYWQTYGVFYALNPLIQPIPLGTHLIEIKNNLGYPYNTELINIVYDPFLVKEGNEYFVTWTKIVPYTVPLYLFKGENGVYITFESKPPYKNMKELIYSPLYVLRDPQYIKPNSEYEKILDDYYHTNQNIKVKSNFEIDKNDQVNFKFIPYQGRCIPKPGGHNIEKCLINVRLEQIEYNKNVENRMGIGDSVTLLSHIADIVEEKNNLTNKNSIKKVSVFIIFIILLIFSISFVICILILLNN